MRHSVFLFLPVLFILHGGGPTPGVAAEDESSLEFKLKTQCRKEYNAEVKDCEIRHADDKDKNSGMMESCLDEARNIFKKCMDEAKAKAQSEEGKDKRGRDKEELLKRWTF